MMRPETDVIQDDDLTSTPSSSACETTCACMTGKYQDRDMHEE